MDHTFQEVLMFITCSVITIAGLLLIGVLIRLFEVLGLLRDTLKRLMFQRNAIKDTLTQIRLFCLKFSREPEGEPEE